MRFAQILYTNSTCNADFIHQQLMRGNIPWIKFGFLTKNSVNHQMVTRFQRRIYTPPEGLRRIYTPLQNHYAEFIHLLKKQSKLFIYNSLNWIKERFQRRICPLFNAEFVHLLYTYKESYKSLPVKPHPIACRRTPRHAQSVALPGEDKTISSGIGAVGKGRGSCGAEDLLFLLPRKESLR